MTIKEIYKRAKRLTLFTNSFEDFISDFGIAEIVLNQRNLKSIE